MSKQSEDLNTALRKGNLPSLIFLSGQETLLVERAVQRIRNAVLIADNDSFNETRLQGKETSAAQILETAMTLPVFAPRRLVTVKDAHLLPAAEMDGLLDYLRDPVPETCLLFVAEKVDSRRKFIQQFKKIGLFVEFKPLAEKELPQYVKSSLERQNLQVSGDAVSLFCSMVGTSLHEVHSELDKLVSYIGERKLIDVKDVQAVVSYTKAENIFAIGNAVAQGDAASALSLVIRLRSGGEAPLKILSLLVRHFRQLWKVRELQAGNHPVRDIAGKAGVPYFIVDTLIAQGRRFSRQDFIRAHELFLETDLAMKSSGADAAALLDRLILALCRKN